MPTDPQKPSAVDAVPDPGSKPDPKPDARTPPEPGGSEVDAVPDAAEVDPKRAG